MGLDEPLAVGSWTQAFALLEAAAEARNPDLCWITINPFFDAVRDHPRFQAVVDQLGLPD